MQGSSHDDVRRRNLGVILRLVHRNGPASRAQLTRLTGLNRSTIGALVAELSARGLVQEHDPDPTRLAGRPSPVVAANPGVTAFAVNPEIDAVTVGLVGLDGVVRRRIRHPTEQSPTVAEAVSIAAGVIQHLAAELESERSPIGIGVAVPGLVRVSDGLVRHAPHLGWVDAPLAELLSAATGLPVRAANDANLGVTAERYFGAGRGVDDLIYLNGGASGIGGGMVVGGMPVRGVAGFAGEFGHARVSGAEQTDSAGIPGTLEAEVRRSALLAVLGLQRADADELEQALLDSHAPSVRAEVNRQLDALAVALAGAVNLLNPEMVVLGGFLAALHAVDPERLRDAVARLSLAAPNGNVRVCAAALGSDLLMIGAAELAFEPVLQDPAGSTQRLAGALDMSDRE